MKDGKDDSFDTGQVVEGGHGPCPTTNFSEDPLDDVGGSKFLPKELRAREECQERVQVFFQTGHRFWDDRFPGFLEISEGNQGGCSRGSVVDGAGIERERRLMFLGHIVGRVSEFMSPTALDFGRGINDFSRIRKSFISIDDEQLKERSF